MLNSCRAYGCLSAWMRCASAFALHRSQMHLCAAAVPAYQHCSVACLLPSLWNTLKNQLQVLVSDTTQRPAATLLILSSLA